MLLRRRCMLGAPRIFYRGSTRIVCASGWQIGPDIRLVRGGANPLLFGNRMRIAFTVLDMIAYDACRADERLTGTRLCERHDERIFLTSIIAPIIASVVAPIIVSVVAPILVVFGNGMIRHLGLPNGGRLRECNRPLLGSRNAS